MSAVSASNLAPSTLFRRNFSREAMFQQLTQNLRPCCTNTTAEQRSWRNAVTKTLVTWWSGRTSLQCLQTLSSDERLVQHSYLDNTKWRVKSCGKWRLCRRFASKYTCRRFEWTVCFHLYFKESKKSEGTTYGLLETSGHSVTSQKTRKWRRENHKIFISGLPTIWTPVEKRTPNAGNVKKGY